MNTPVSSRGQGEKHVCVITHGEAGREACREGQIPAAKALLTPHRLIRREHSLTTVPGSGLFLPWEAQSELKAWIQGCSMALGLVWGRTCCGGALQHLWTKGE